MNNENIFYMVYIDGTNSATVKHNSWKLAEEECKRLVIKTGKKGFVLKMIESIEVEHNFKVGYF